MLNSKKTEKIKKISHYGAFSLMEAMLSVFMLSVGMITIMLLTSSSIRESYDSRDQEISALLAQEGIELMRNLRDNNWLSAGGATFSNFPANNSYDCKIDVSGFVGCSGANYELNYATSGAFKNLYVHSSGTATRFKRQIWITYDTGSNSDANSAVITSMVVWGGGSFQSLNNCNTINRCSYAQGTLTRWGE